MNYLKKIYSGRINRKNYILGFFAVVLVPVAILMVLLYIPVLFSSSPSVSGDTSNFAAIVAGILCLALLIFIFSLHVRRLHDLGKSGWVALVFCVPIVNAILLLVLIFSKGKPDANKYGASPKGEGFAKAVFKTS